MTTTATVTRIVASGTPRLAAASRSRRPCAAIAASPFIWAVGPLALSQPTWGR